MVLRDEIDVFSARVINDLLQPDDIGVLQKLENLDLIFHTIPRGLFVAKAILLQVGLVHLLYSVECLRLHILAKVHRGELAGPEFFLKHILVNNFLLLRIGLRWLVLLFFDEGCHLDLLLPTLGAHLANDCAGSQDGKITLGILLTGFSEGNLRRVCLVCRNLHSFMPINFDILFQTEELWLLLLIFAFIRLFYFLVDTYHVKLKFTVTVGTKLFTYGF